MSWIYPEGGHRYWESDGEGTSEYIVTLTGCDDEHSIPMDLTDMQAEAIAELARLSVAFSTSDRQPTMRIVAREAASAYSTEHADERKAEVESGVER